MAVHPRTATGQFQRSHSELLSLADLPTRHSAVAALPGFRLTRIVGRQGIQRGLYLSKLRLVNDRPRRRDEGITSHVRAKCCQRTSVVDSPRNSQAHPHEQCTGMPNSRIGVLLFFRLFAAKRGAGEGARATRRAEMSG